jgi:hypothetical protein
VRSRGPSEGELRFPFALSEKNNLHRGEYRYRRLGYPVGEWRHGGDIGPGRKDVYIRSSDFPADAKPGERIGVDFRVYNGESYSEDAASADIVVNTPPLIEYSTSERSAMTRAEGESLVLPFSISDDDGDALTVLYKIDDDVTWSILPTSSSPNVLPADLVSRVLSGPDSHRVTVTAFDCRQAPLG